MEKDYENASGADQLSDNELRALIVDTFDQQVAFDPNDVEIAVAMLSANRKNCRHDSSTDDGSRR